MGPGARPDVLKTKNVFFCRDSGTPKFRTRTEYDIPVYEQHNFAAETVRLLLQRS